MWLNHRPISAEPQLLAAASPAADDDDAIERAGLGFSPPTPAGYSL